jgi:hypothetical protein
MGGAEQAQRLCRVRWFPQPAIDRYCHRNRGGGYLYSAVGDATVREIKEYLNQGKADGG